MHRYRAAELHDFFRILDAELPGPIEITVIGGAAVGLVYVTDHATTDIDLKPVSSAVLWEAVKRAQAHTANPISVTNAGPYEAPYDWEDRRQAIDIPGVTKVRIFVPERHDLALMKVARGVSHDLQAIEDMHHQSPFRLATLISRYHDMRRQHIGSHSELQLTFVALIERLFGAEQAKQVDRELSSQPPPPIRSL
jgi:hypothetical protein